MKIIDILNNKEVTLSFEVFPPKTDDKYAAVEKASAEIAALKPDFMSVTYGAGGGTSKNTANISADLQNKYGVTVLSHLCCLICLLFSYCLQSVSNIDLSCKSEVFLVCFQYRLNNFCKELIYLMSTASNILAGIH